MENVRLFRRSSSSAAAAGNAKATVFFVNSSLTSTKHEHTYVMLIDTLIVVSTFLFALRTALDKYYFGTDISGSKWSKQHEKQLIIWKLKFDTILKHAKHRRVCPIQYIYSNRWNEKLQILVSKRITLNGQTDGHKGYALMLFFFLTHLNKLGLQRLWSLLFHLNRTDQIIN